MNRSTPSSSGRVITDRTLIGSGLLAALVAAYGVLGARMYADVLTETQYVLAFWYGTLLQVLLAGVILSVARTIGWQQSVGKQWFLIGAGVSAYSIGDVLWTIYEVHLGVYPYPSAADLFYTVQYPLFLSAMVLAVASYRGFVDLRKPVLAGVIVSIAAAVAVYLTLLRPYIFDAGVEGLGFWGLVVSTLYPLGDVFFMVGPALTLALVILSLGAGRFGWPWWIVVVGALTFAITDSAYAYRDWAGLGSNTLLDLGWLTANLLFAVAALVARDVYRVR